jgi:protein-S-isoprenylcysteine O-methyltransferase Ste14
MACHELVEWYTRSMKTGFKVFLGIVSASPVLFLVGLVISFFVYIQFPIPLIRSAISADVMTGIGMVLILAGTFLAFAAQRVSRVVARPSTKATCPDLMKGPYRYSRHPGSLSLMIMYVGCVFLVNSLVMAIAAVILILLLTFIFVPMSEKVISSLCPEAYREYKSKVRMWL